MGIRKCTKCEWDSNALFPHDKSCSGIIEVVRESSPLEMAEGVRRVVASKTLTTDQYEEAFKKMFPVGPVEVRSVSSTGGQKGVKLQRFDLIPVEPLAMLAEHFGRGAKKYDAHQWRNGYEWSKSYSAMQRHLVAFWAGDDFDMCNPHKEALGECLFEMDGKKWDGEPGTCWNHTGSHHMVAVAWHAFVLLEFVDKHPEHDDRYIYPPEEVKE